MTALELLFTELLKKYTKDIDYVNRCWRELEGLYSASDRYYHTLTHLERMWAEAEALLPELSYPDAFLLALFYHDAVYDVERRDNEEKSADLCAEHLRKTDYPEINRVRALILATKRHESGDSFDMDAFTDLDLAILGSDPETYDAYARAIRLEYGRFRPEDNERGRGEILRRFLSLPAIYKTPRFREKYEALARANLTRELSFIREILS
jgi:predicted metal-dependent HD superfamily phosphohydrolase